MNLECSIIAIDAQDDFKVRVVPTVRGITFKFKGYQVSIDNPSPENIETEVSMDGYEFTYRRPGYRFEEWMSHIMEIFQSRSILHFKKKLPDLKSFRKCLDSYRVMSISEDLNTIDIREILKLFSVQKELVLGSNPFSNKIESNPFLHEVYIQNYDMLYLVEWTKIELDDLLAMNAKYLQIECPIISERDLNRFIKHWMAGSNPRLEHLDISFDGRVWDKSALLRGIEHQVIPDGYVRRLPDYITASGEYEYIRGGYDFHRKDGTRATVLPRIYGDYDFHIFVWY
ncbi:hypothetical protein GCK72_008278 [Caenorhabditis remanei]|uniref:Sdz-33 F-box domain-containing protein n=1 Tax=Caenorhabditis remanei TaxID=31234 RepID=A0A6A5H0K8_CAERE|nr:hypothetical protein GCK72_008278 [Caenorhabditis remanei]KAF1760032.1 hypothetical protein GCK72_008278 [Caenorhabditis remanei]